MEERKIIVCGYDENLLPTQETAGAMCWDVRCSEDFVVESRKIKLTWTGIKTYLPDGFWVRMYARSSLPTKMGLMMANGVAVIDSDYRWEYKLQFYNWTDDEVKIQRWTRLTQIEFFNNNGEKIPKIEFMVDEELYRDFESKFSSERGVGWIGSTGY